jgi:hypothetical protein
MVWALGLLWVASLVDAGLVAVGGPHFNKFTTQQGFERQREHGVPPPPQSCIRGGGVRWLVHLVLVWFR